jgi:D-glycero-alpha-D-manno-heptose-7-phosphate kinase
MIISRTPYRVSFFGGGTDYPGWYREHGGAVLATTINHYCYITCRFLPPFFDHLSRVVWSKVEVVQNNSEIEHPAVRGAMSLLKMADGVEVHHSGDLPARSGLGSSSSFSVGLLNALHVLRGEPKSKLELCTQAIDLEQNVLGEHVGVQDQIGTAFGGFNQIDLKQDGSFEVRPISASRARLKSLESHILMFYTGVARNASDIAAAQVRTINQHKAELTEMHRMVGQANDLVVSGDTIGFGKLLHESWQIKRGLSDKIAPAFVDDIYQRARGAGAIGGKLLGAGGGGFMLFVVRPNDHIKVLSALSELLLVPIKFESSGTQIVFDESPRYSRTAKHKRDFRRFITGSNANGKP